MQGGSLGISLASTLIERRYRAVQGGSWASLLLMETLPPLVGSGGEARKPGGGSAELWGVKQMSMGMSRGNFDFLWRRWNGGLASQGGGMEARPVGGPDRGPSA